VGVKIVKATELDVTGIITFKKQLAEQSAFMPYTAERQAADKRMGDDIIAGKEIVYLLKHNNYVQGVINATYYSDNNQYIISIGILKKYRRKGYGNLMVQYLMEYLQRHGKKADITLFVSPSNVAAIKLYSNFNFKVIKEYTHDNELINEMYGPLLIMQYLP
jgi:ribosomal protein S18 acetylase RimI-like enzyme